MKTTHPLKNLAISFSGGGYRAAAYHLGVLSYLNHVQANNEPLVKQVMMISTISGGTITGVKYALCLAQGKSFERFFEELYDFLEKDFIMDEAFKTLNTAKNWQFKTKSKNLINAFSVIYQKTLLDNAHFGQLLDYTAKTGVEFMFNATDLENSKPFRFQTSPKGLIGNKDHQIPREKAKDIRLGDIVSASSCFPGGFEPMIFPHDFLDNQTEKFDARWETPVLRIMDGGIVDNQGMESIWLAEDRKDTNEAYFIGTYIVSDVALKEIIMPEPEPEDKGFFYQLGRMSIQHYYWIFTPLFFISLLLIAFFDNKWLIFFATICFTLTLGLLALKIKIAKITRQTLRSTLSQKTPKFINDIRVINKISLNRLYHHVDVRINSIIKLNNTVFLARLRQLHYESTYDNSRWKFRTFSNLIYELPKYFKAEKEEAAPALLQLAKSPKINDIVVSPALYKRVNSANMMDTTLWFSDDEKEDNQMLNNLIICGQATQCFRLKAYLKRRLEDTETLPEGSAPDILAVLAQLTEDINRFNEDPQWLMKQYIKA